MTVRNSIRIAVAAVMILLANLLSLKMATAADSAWKRIQETGVVKVGVIPNRPPYFYAGKDNEWIGFNADMSRSIVSALEVAMDKKLKTEWVLSNFQTIVLDLQAGKIDFFLGMTATEERKRALNMFGPLWFVPNVALNSANFKPGDKWEDYDKKGNKFSVVMGSTDEAAAHVHIKNAEIRSMKGMAEAVLDVQSGNSNAMITSVFNGLGALKQNPTLGGLTLLMPAYALPSGGGTRRDDDGQLYTFLQGWSWAYRAGGLAERDIVNAMKVYELPTNSLPTDLKF